jgi:hypothetical protein
MLLSIMINLSLLTFSLVRAIIWGNKKTDKRLINLLSTFVPLILIIAGYALEGTTASVAEVEGLFIYLVHCMTCCHMRR